MTEVPYEEVKNSIYFDYYNSYKFFDRWDYSDQLINENLTDYYEGTYYENYDPAALFVFPNLTQYGKLHEFLVQSANERNSSTFNNRNKSNVNNLMLYSQVF